MTPRTLPRKRVVIRAAIYCRISLSRLGDTVKVDDQEKLCRGLAATRKWRVSPEHVFTDNSRSAWQRNRKRPGWDAMLLAVERGEIDAIIVYHGDRLIRQPWDLEVLLRLADDKGIRLASPTGERNLDSADDRFILRIEAAQACRESDNTSRRLRWHFDKQAELGLVRLGGRGGRAFGFEPDGLTVREADKEMLQEVADRILASEPVGAICRDLNARGFVTATGGPWDHGALKKLMCRPRLAGLVAHNGQIIGPAAWPEILDRDVWETVVATLDMKAGHFAYATNAARYLLTGIALCGTPVCGAPLVIRHNTRSESLRGYGCISPTCPKKVHRSVHHLDPYVEGATIARLNDERVRERMTVAPDPALAAELRKVEARRAATLAEFADDDELGPDVLRVTLRRLNARADELIGRMRAAQASDALADLWGLDKPGWDALPLPRQRAAVRAVVRVTVLPAKRRGPGFDPSAVVLADPVAV